MNIAPIENIAPNQTACKKLSMCDQFSFNKMMIFINIAPIEKYFLSVDIGYKKLSMCDQFSFNKMTIFINIAPIEKYLVCVDKIGSCNA